MPLFISEVHARACNAECTGAYHIGMLIELHGKAPRIDPSALVAPTAVVCGEVSIGANSCVLFGAVITAESGPVTIGSECIIMENAVLRGVSRHPLRIADHVLVGPHVHLSGCTVEENAFLATGTTVFNGAVIGARSEVRVGGVVHLNSRLVDDGLVPIGWVAVGDPAQIFPPAEHARIWGVQEPLHFPRTVFGVERAPPGQSTMPEVTRRYARALRQAYARPAAD